MTGFVLQGHFCEIYQHFLSENCLYNNVFLLKLFCRSVREAPRQKHKHTRSDETVCRAVFGLQSQL